MSASSTDAPVLGDRPYPLTDDDHRGIALTMSILFLVYTIMVLVMRVAGRYRNMGVDDWLSIAATALAVPQFITVMAATADGFGSSYTLISSSHVDTIAKCIRASDVLFLLSLGVAKCSAVWLCRRLFAVGQHERHLLCEVSMGLCAAWCLGSILAATVGCTSTETIRLNSTKCSGLLNRWIAIGVLDAVLEVLLLVLSAVVIFPLRMSLPRKAQAFTCFLLRIPIIVLIGLHIKYLSSFTSASDPGVALTRPILFRQSELLYSLLSAAIPTLNQYLRKFDTKQATQFGYTPGQYGSGGQSYPMDTVTAQSTQTRTGAGRTRTKGGNGKASETWGKSTGSNFNPPTHAQYQATIEGPNGTSNDGTSNTSYQEEGSVERHNSEEHIIRKELDYQVRYEG